jgi:hypothetical protein
MILSAKKIKLKQNKEVRKQKNAKKIAKAFGNSQISHHSLITNSRSAIKKNINFRANSQ